MPKAVFESVTRSARPSSRKRGGVGGGATGSGSFWDVTWWPRVEHPGQPRSRSTNAHPATAPRPTAPSAIIVTPAPSRLHATAAAVASGSHPRSVPAVRPHSRSVPAVRPHPRSVPAVRPHSRSVPSVRPHSRSVPSVRTHSRPVPARRSHACPRREPTSPRAANGRPVAPLPTARAQHPAAPTTNVSRPDVDVARSRPNPSAGPPDVARARPVVVAIDPDGAGKGPRRTHDGGRWGRCLSDHGPAHRIGTSTGGKRDRRGERQGQVKCLHAFSNRSKAASAASVDRRRRTRRACASSRRRRKSRWCSRCRQRYSGCHCTPSHQRPDCSGSMA